jgi:hypothetical protein
MFPGSNSSSQELLLALCQSQMQNGMNQANPLAQLMKLNLQMNMLKLLNMDPAATTTLDSNQSGLFSLTSYLNQTTTGANQSTKAANSQLSNVLLFNKFSPKTQLGSEKGLDTSLTQALVSKSDLSVSSKKGSKNAKSIKIPAFAGLSDQNSLEQDSDGNDNDMEGLSARSKKIKKANSCGHPERSHYAKNMCNQCYHKHGRTKKPWRCSHEKLYAHGLCQNCYINAYNKKRSDQAKEKKDNSSTPELDTDLPSSIHSSDEPLILEDKAAFGEFEEKRIEN